MASHSLAFCLPWPCRLTGHVQSSKRVAAMAAIPSTTRGSFAAALAASVLLVTLAGHTLAAVPEDLSNYQNNFPCDTRVRLVRPSTLDDVQAAVGAHAKVRANGEGHSWNQPFFCANLTNPDARGNGMTSANIQLSTIRPLGITLDEDNETVTVSAGIMTIDLLNYLANYVTRKAPAGWTLPAFPWFVYQTIGGAVATGTHGSSLPWKSLSSQTLEITLVLANGTVRTFNDEADPFLMKAVRLSVGKLGILTSLKLRIVKEQPVQRILRSGVLPSVFLASLREAQAQYLSTGSLPDWANETEWFWITQRNQFSMVSYVRGDVADPALRSEVLIAYEPQITTVYNTTASVLQQVAGADGRVLSLPILNGTVFGPLGIATGAQEYLNNLTAGFNAPLTFAPPPVEASSVDTKEVQALGRRDRMRRLFQTNADPAVEGVSWVVPVMPPALGFYASGSMAGTYLDLSQVGVESIAANATLEAESSYLYQPLELRNNIRTIPYDQYEVAIPAASMADCWEGLLELVYQGDMDGYNDTLSAVDKGFRTAPLIRFLGHENSTLLSLAQDGPRMYINVEDYVYYNAGNKVNQPFHDIIGYLRSDRRCGGNGTGGRLHWGKAGWPEHGCWHGDAEFPDTWCDFGCAVLALDPTSKFADSSDRWNWDGIDLSRCCSESGFNTSLTGCSCTVQHSRSLEECPPPPFYTQR